MRAGRHKTRLAATAVQSAVEARVTHSLMDRRAARSTRGGNGPRQAARMKKANHQRCSRVAAAAAASWIAASWSARGSNGAEGGGGRRARRACDSACQRSLLLLLAATAWIASLELGTRRQWLARQHGGRRERMWLCWLLLACGGGSPGCCCGGEMDGQNRMAMALEFGTEILKKYVPESRTISRTAGL